MNLTINYQKKKNIKDRWSIYRSFKELGKKERTYCSESIQKQSLKWKLSNQFINVSNANPPLTTTWWSYKLKKSKNLIVFSVRRIYSKKIASGSANAKAQWCAGNAKNWILICIAARTDTNLKRRQVLPGLCSSVPNVENK